MVTTTSRRPKAVRVSIAACDGLRVAWVFFFRSFWCAKPNRHHKLTTCFSQFYLHTDANQYRVHSYEHRAPNRYCCVEKGRRRTASPATKITSKQRLFGNLKQNMPPCEALNTSLTTRESPLVRCVAIKKISGHYARPREAVHKTPPFVATA
jgi:hypothetical protein